jgi:hypothetical protein
VNLIIATNDLGMLAVRLFFFFFFKHFIADFCLQTPYMYKNKGNIWHPGGYLHAFVHAYLSLFILFGNHVQASVAFTLVFIEFWVHFGTDWAKVNINKATGWTAVNSEGFWVLLGLDQFIHSLTYLGMIWYVLKVFANG